MHHGGRVLLGLGLRKFDAHTAPISLSDKQSLEG